MNIRKQLRALGFADDVIDRATVQGVPIGQFREERTKEPAFDYEAHRREDWTEPVLDLFIPVKTMSEGNTRNQWQQITRKKAQKITVREHWMIAVGLQYRFPRPARITLTRHGPRTLDDDNLAGALKWVRDEVCRAIGHDDGPQPGINFAYAQKRGEYGVQVHIEW